MTTWTLPEDTDAEVRRWLRTKGWTVTAADFDYEQAVYTWLAQSTRSGLKPAVRVSQQVLTDFPWYAVLENFERLRLADAIPRRPAAKYVVVQRGLEVRLEEVP